MSLPSDRFVLLGTTEHPHEKEALDFVRDNFPSSDPHHARGLVELQDPSSGRLYEIDLLVIGYAAIYLVEIKSHPGTIEGDDQGWWWTPPDENRKIHVDNPYSLTNHKCKVLRSLLDRKLRRANVATPFVQPLIFLSAKDVKNKLAPWGRTAVVTRHDVIKAIQFGEFPGNDKSRQRRINTPTMRALKQAFDQLGLKPRKGQLEVGEYVLGPVVEDGEHYQDREATHRHFEHMKHRARVYLVPEQSSVEQRQRLKRAAEREVQLLWSVRDQPNVLTSVYYAPQAPLGPTLVFEDFEGGIRLDRYLKQHPELGFDQRVEILRQIGHALHYCHRRNVVHGGLCPEAVLVRERDGRLETRLFDFHLGAGEDASATVHRTVLAQSNAGAYQAPELAANPTATTSASDTFSLGALAYFLLTGQPPADNTSELLLRLHRDNHLDPGIVDDSLPPPVTEAIIAATQLALTDRINDARDWVEILSLELREYAKVPPESSAPVLEADTGDILAERFTVERLLGHGASARVLLVRDEHDGRLYALKVARDAEHDDRVRQEGEELARLRHNRIVQCHEVLELDDRVCLLLSFAGERSLQSHITAEGSLDLELAGRYGEDLLDALKALEDEAILHRDIKPANLGVGDKKKVAKHLMLYDFSLAGTPLDNLGVGTAAYRDPFLPLRERWDHAADRWSAAVTLHEMLTGLRPRYGRLTGSPLDPDAQLVLEAERFDAAVRDRLIEFFTKALARDATERFGSAAEMARAWAACLSPQLQVPVEPRPEATTSTATQTQTAAEAAERRGTRVQVGAVTDEEIAAIERTTQIRALPLSPRALNALDRAGLTRAEELLGLVNNRLSAIRGIGTKVAREILQLRDRWQAHLGSEEGPPSAPLFYSDYTGPEIFVGNLEIEEALVTLLEDAGLSTAPAVARAPKSQVDAIVARGGFEAAALRQALAARETTESDAAPSTIEGWLAAVLAAVPKLRSEQADLLRAMLGLDPATATMTMAELAAHRGTSAAKLQKLLADAIRAWREAGWSTALRETCIGAVESLGGVATMAEAAMALKTKLGHDVDAPAEQVDAQLTALLRVGAELGSDEDGRRLQLRRTPRDKLDHVTGEIHPTVTAWTLSGDEELWLRVKRLGELADELASRPVLAASGETVRLLSEAVEDSPLKLDEVGKQRLVQLAAAASQKAAPSSRLELYPVGMPADRALELSAQALTGSMTEEVLRTRVHARYPEARRLPTRVTGLDRMVERLNLRWNDEDGKFERPEARDFTSLLSTGTSLNPLPTAMPGQTRSKSEEAIRARDFTDRLRGVLQERKLRVWSVNPSGLMEAVARLEKEMEVEAIELDRRLIDKMERVLLSKGGKPEILSKTDAAGPAGPGWANLLAVAREAAAELATELFPAKRPLLLTQAGLLARYNLSEFVEAMIEASQRDDCEAIVLINPAHDGDRPDVINGLLPVKGLLPGQLDRLPRDWIENRDKAATAHPA